MKEGSKVIGDAIDQITESIKYVRGSKSRMINFKQCIEQVGVLMLQVLCL